ncbi:E3 ubiquitin-protein ligase RNF144B-like [Zingiber officinale]|uniref:E3 ubiquitin-protein ligase RNF144B-like n=1 Tax=Zingiber officinale TaxID=94328 RepID=UPI001C4C745E|nr:E3 ubiquitin-protein ligase RNF144B-like [Zingiber officinale]
MARPPVSTLIRIKEKGESSSLSLASPSPATFFCKICMDAPPDADMFTNGAAPTPSAVTASVTTSARRSILEPQSFRGMIPCEVFDWWEAAACEAAILGMNRIYCPFKGCSAALLVDDEDGGVATLKKAECPHCRRLFCALCKAGWHGELSCSEFQRLRTKERRREDLLLMEVAKEKGWKRCPKCKFFVEKTAGCLHITCRCGHEFCYGCGSKWATIHASCSTPN